MPAIITSQRHANGLSSGVISLLGSDQGGKPTRRIQKALEGKKPDTQWGIWAKYLAQRRKPQTIRKLAQGATANSPLLWAADEAGLSDQATVELIQRLAKLGLQKRLDADQELCQMLTFWLDESNGRRPDPAYGLQCLAWAHALPALVSRIPASLWYELLSHLADTADQAQHIRASEHPLAHQLLAGELPLTMGYVLPEVSICQQQRSIGPETLSDGIDHLLDGEGLLQWRHLPLLRPLLACWTRANLVASRTKGAKLKSVAKTQYAYLVEQALRLTRTDGTQVFGDHHSRHKLPVDMIRAALTLIDDPECVALARKLFPKKLVPATGSATELPDNPSVNSEWAGFAVMRANWSSTSPRFAVAYAGRNMETELTCGREVIWSGRCRPSVEIDGTVLQPDSDWEEVCWFTDDDVDYLEVEIGLEHGWRIQRQMCLAREDNFLFVADAVLGGASAQIRYRSSWPLRPGIHFRPRDETRDGFLAGRKRLGLVLPLALPEWRVDRRVGELNAEGDCLELRQEGQGTALFAPLFVDLDSRRMRKAATWRQLTVAERLDIVRPDTAVGYRVLVGGEQWMMYRSLTAPSSRTLLGQHIAAECIIAKFDEDGEADPMVEVETE